MLTPVLPPHSALQPFMALLHGQHGGTDTKPGATRLAHSGYGIRAVLGLCHLPPTLPPSLGRCHLRGGTATFLWDTGIFLGTLPPSQARCHLPRDMATFCEDIAFLSGNTATFPVMSQPS